MKNKNIIFLLLYLLPIIGTIIYAIVLVSGWGKYDFLESLREVVRLSFTVMFVFSPCFGFYYIFVITLHTLMIKHQELTILSKVSIILSSICALTSLGLFGCAIVLDDLFLSLNTFLGLIFISVVIFIICISFPIEKNNVEIYREG